MPDCFISQAANCLQKVAQVAKFPVLISSPILRSIIPDFASTQLLLNHFKQMPYCHCVCLVGLLHANMM